MSKYRRLSSVATVVSVVVVATTAAVATDRFGPGATFAPSAVAAALLAAAFAWRPIDGLASFAVMALMADTIEHWTGVSLRTLDEITIPLLVVAAGVVHRHRLVVPRFGWRDAGLVVMVGAGVASSLASAVPVQVWGTGLVLLVKGFVLFYLLLSLRIDRQDVGRLVAVVGAIAALIIVVGFLEFLAPSAVQSTLGLPPFEQRRGGLTVVKSVFLHPALFGWITAFVGLFAYARFAILRERWALLVGLLLTIGTLLSGRRTPLLGIGAGLLIGGARLAAGGWLARRTWVPVAVMLGVLVAISFPVLGRFYATTIEEYLPSRELVEEILSADPDPLALRYMQPRVGLTLGSVAVARDHMPLGAGIGRFGSHMSREVYSPVYARYGMDQMYGIKAEQPIAVTDTFWPMILGETGLIGLLGALVFFGAVGVQLWRAVGRTEDLAIRAFVLGALLVYVEGLVRTLTSPVFVAPPIAYFILGAAALALAATRDLRPGPAAVPA